FVNPVILRADLSGNPSFCIFLERVREMTSDAFAHQDYPFALLVERFQPTRDPSRSPLFQVMFALHKAPSFGDEFLVSRALVEGASFKCGGLSAESVALRRLTSRFDLNLSVVETEEGLKGFIEYNPDLFDEWRIRRMAEHFRTLAEAVTADPKQRIGEIGLLNEAERQQILVEWNKTEREYCPRLSVHEMIREQAWRRAEAVAVRSEQGELSYRELDRRANQLARYLGGKGIGREDVVGICADRSAAMVIAMLGILKAGAAYLPIDGDYPVERIRYMLEDTSGEGLLDR